MKNAPVRPTPEALSAITVGAGCDGRLGGPSLPSSVLTLFTKKNGCGSPVWSGVGSENRPLPKRSTVGGVRAVGLARQRNQAKGQGPPGHEGGAAIEIENGSSGRISIVRSRAAPGESFTKRTSVISPAAAFTVPRRTS